MATKLFSRQNEGETTDLGSGNKRRVLLHTDELMMVEFTFEKGGVGALHSHPHVQASYIAEGQFEVTVGEEKATLSAGDSFIVPSNVVHGVVALEAGRLIDSFTPHRADFLA
ncbi:cupin domain-containing protein [Rhizobium sp. LC145]|uniref:cupin domain-containing protein n=1 Tax=Rhizobium sp. LC145 TaxID=1120688 RepID=UPI000629F7AB|nr:cupin domain-containing protein [Rhizobium sp. LC145]KKX30783.1 cupin [Rhizobium sp. LC145]TKT68488.1 cupin domain-containing protein [Rhizobiaceae bacterium LC148]